MKRITLIAFVIFFINLIAQLSVSAQKIEYDFGDESYVIDSVKYVIDWYKKSYKESDGIKLGLFAGMDYCDGHINLYISQYLGKSEDMIRLIKKTNRFIKVSDNLRLPLIFQTDVLAKDLKEKIIFIKMNGYYLKIVKDEKYIWKVTQMNQTW
jgi:hypothetical protein